MSEEAFFSKYALGQEWQANELNLRHDTNNRLLSLYGDVSWFVFFPFYFVSAATRIAVETGMGGEASFLTLAVTA